MKSMLDTGSLMLDIMVIDDHGFSSSTQHQVSSILDLE
jgi:hypothetical protein